MDDNYSVAGAPEAIYSSQPIQSEYNAAEMSKGDLPILPKKLILGGCDAIHRKISIHLNALCDQKLDPFMSATLACACFISAKGEIDTVFSTIQGGAHKHLTQDRIKSAGALIASCKADKAVAYIGNVWANTGLLLNRVSGGEFNINPEHIVINGSINGSMFSPEMSGSYSDSGAGASTLSFEQLTHQQDCAVFFFLHNEQKNKVLSIATTFFRKQFRIIVPDQVIATIRSLKSAQIGRVIPIALSSVYSDLDKFTAFIFKANSKSPMLPPGMSSPPLSTRAPAPPVAPKPKNSTTTG
ncbi:hypothetical protein [Pelagibaculum spongiae]|nr:hypothetical protein [Pelagibaculum spongiae]